MNWSSERAGHAEFLSFGFAGSSGGTKDQCSLHFAPSLIQRRNVAISWSESRGPWSGLGINSSRSFEVTRRMSSDFSGAPGTMGISPDFAGASAFSRYTSDSLPAAFTPPWQAVQCLAKSGRMSWLKSTGAGFSARPKNAAGASTAKRVPSNNDSFKACARMISAMVISNGV